MNKDGKNTPDFIFKHEQLEGFPGYYAQTIRPDLKRHDKRRILGLITIILAWPIILFAGYWLYVWMNDKTGLPTDKAVIFSAVITGAVLIFTTVMAFQKTAALTKSTLVTAVCGFFGWKFFPVVRHINFLDEFETYGLVPSAYSDVHFSDKVVGEIYDTAFNSLEVQILDDKALAKGKRRVQVFRGTLFRIVFPKKVFGETVVLRTKGIFNPKRKGKLKRVGLVDPIFKKAFQAYGSDQVEARYILTPEIMQHMVDLETTMGGQNIRFGFMRHQLLVAVETGKRFGAGSMLKPLDDPARAQRILDEVGAIYDVVDDILTRIG